MIDPKSESVLATKRSTRLPLLLGEHNTDVKGFNYHALSDEPCL